MTMSTVLRVRGVWFFAALAGLGGLTVGMTMAAIPAPDGTIRSCYNKKTGRLRVIDEGASCKPKEIVLTWAQAGTPGPSGPPGDVGEPATRLWAVVTSSGNLRRGSGVTVPVGTDLSAVGNTRVVPFDRDISECAVVATIVGADVNEGVSAGIITATLASDQSVRVRMNDPEATMIDNQAFHVAVFC
jgi:hypothetical protein